MQTDAANIIVRSEELAIAREIIRLAGLGRETFQITQGVPGIRNTTSGRITRHRVAAANVTIAEARVMDARLAIGAANSLAARYRRPGYPAIAERSLHVGAALGEFSRARAALLHARRLLGATPRIVEAAPDTFGMEINPRVVALAASFAKQKVGVSHFAVDDIRILRNLASAHGIPLHVPATVSTLMAAE